MIVSGDDTHVVAAHPVERLVDTTGAGDLYAAGFLCGYTRGDDLDDVRAAGLARGVRGDLAPRRPSGDRRSPTWPRC